MNYEKKKKEKKSLFLLDLVEDDVRNRFVFPLAAFIVYIVIAFGILTPPATVISNFFLFFKKMILIYYQFFNYYIFKNRY